MSAQNKIEKADKAYKRTYKFFRLPFKLLCKWKLGFDAKPKTYNEPLLILSTHTTDFDFTAVSRLIKDPCYYLCSQHILGMKFIGKPFEKLFNPIAVFKGGNKMSEVMEVVKRIRRGNSVLIFPEGRLSHNGRTAEIHFSTAKLAKLAKCKVVVVRQYGGFFIAPRWQTYLNGGKLFGAEIAAEYTKEQIAEISTEELYEELKKQLFVDHYAIQRQRMQKFKWKHGIRDIMRYYDVCPCCGKLDQLSAKGFTVTCNSCGHSFYMDEYGFFHSDDENFQTTYDWERIQLQRYKQLLYDDKQKMTDDGVTLYKVGHRLAKTLISVQDLSCDAKNLYFGNKTVPFAQINAMDILAGGSALELTIGNDHYELYKEGACLNKYLEAQKFVLGFDPQ